MKYIYENAIKVKKVWKFQCSECNNVEFITDDEFANGKNYLGWDGCSHLRIHICQNCKKEFTIYHQYYN